MADEGLSAGGFLNRQGTRTPRNSFPWRLGGSSLLALALVACGGAIGQETVESPAAPLATGFENDGWGRYDSLRFALSLGLPEGRAWSIDDRKSPWLVATHADTSSLLRVRAWHEPRAVSREACLERSRELDPSLPEPDEASVVDERIESIGNDDTSVHIRAGFRREGEGIEGIVIASGVSIRRCFTLIFESRARGPGAEAAIVDRLAMVTEGIVPKLRLTTPLHVPRR